MTRAYYNEIDPYAAEWLRNLIMCDLIAPGDVDTRGIVDVCPSDLKGFTQCHFFAGIGVWSHSARMAGWPDERPLWTGSCPCQPFSAAGKGAGFTDERHLWPSWFWLISQCRPETIFGEQVASQDGLNWLDLVQADLEGADYANAAFDLCAAGVGAPHIRQRLYFVGQSHSDGLFKRRAAAEAARYGSATLTAGSDGQLADAGSERRIEVGSHVEGSGSRSGAQGLEQRPLHGGAGNIVGHTDDAGSQGRSERRDGADQRAAGAPGVASFWSDAEWVPCRDGKWRPVEPGTFPLAHGATARVGRLRAYGNAICAPLAKEFIAAYLECAP